MNRTTVALSCVLGCSCGLASAQTPLDTSFAYQGYLAVSGAPASGLHDLKFMLYDAAIGGSQIGPTLCADDVLPVDGRFTASLDFGDRFTGDQRFLEIDVRADTGLDCTNLAGFVKLGPRQPLTAAPNSLFSLNAQAAANAAQLNGQPAGFYQNASNLTTGTLPDGRLDVRVARTDIPQTFTGSMTFSNPGNAFTGSGAGLTLLNASSLVSGTVSDFRLTPNVALLSGPQNFSGVKTFSAAPAFVSPGAPFSVSGATVVTNLNADLLDGLHGAAYGQLAAPQTWSGSNTFQNVANSFIGSGAGLTSLNASNISTGTLADARLSTNVGLLAGDQTFTGVKTFLAAPAFTAAGAPFSVSGTNVVTNLNADRLDGYHAGNASGQVPVSNGTVSTNLNADKVDSSHVVPSNVYTNSGTQYVANTGYCRIYATGVPNVLRLENPAGSGYTLRYYYSIDYAAPVFGNLAAGTTLDIANLNNTTIDIRIYTGGGWMVYMGASGGNGWFRGHVIYTD